MEVAPFNFQHYLVAKRSVDDRALNMRVWNALVKLACPTHAGAPLRIIEIAAGVGTMFQRAWEWGWITQADYLALDSDAQNVAFANQAIREWAEQWNLNLEALDDGFRVIGSPRTAAIHWTVADFFDFATDPKWHGAFDVLIAHAFLDLVNLEEALPLLMRLVRPGGLLYLTLNFDGLTAWLPTLDPLFDETVVRLYHQSMDMRLARGKRTAGSLAGRALLEMLPGLGVRILDVGASDWVVYPENEGRYPADEAYFLHCILHFVEETLGGSHELPFEALTAWLDVRRKQIEHGELIFLAHQLDFLVQVPYYG